MPPPDFYSILGVPEDAGEAEIRAAFRSKAFAHHPDTNPDAGQAEAQHFLQVQEAYGVLRDASKRAQYDRWRAAGFQGGGAGEEWGAGAGSSEGSYSSATPWGQPSMDERDFDRRFEEWWRKMGTDFDDWEERQFREERLNAERRLKAAAWEWEKQQATLNKVRHQKLKQRTENAKMQRHATVLRRFWQTHPGFTRGDALVAGLVLAATAGIAWTWRDMLRPAAAAVEQPERQRAHAPGLPAAAAAVVAAAGQPP